MRRQAKPISQVAVGLLLVAMSGWSAFAQDRDAEQRAVINREYAIKAAFLYHFSTYIQWPDEMLPAESDPFVIGVYRENPFGSALEKIAETKTVNGRPIVIRQITTPGEARHCQILFVPGSVPQEQQNAVLRAVQGLPVLVVGESDGFVARGGDVQFYLQGNKVRFAFNADLAKQENLKVSSKLLSVAEIIPGR
jgi:YfiR/HmsC-like